MQTPFLAASPTLPHDWISTYQGYLLRYNKFAFTFVHCFVLSTYMLKKIKCTEPRKGNVLYFFNSWQKKKKKKKKIHMSLPGLQTSGVPYNVHSFGHLKNLAMLVFPHHINTEKLCLRGNRKHVILKLIQTVLNFDNIYFVCTCFTFLLKVRKILHLYYHHLYHHSFRSSLTLKTENGQDRPKPLIERDRNGTCIIRVTCPAALNGYYWTCPGISDFILYQNFFKLTNTNNSIICVRVTFSYILQ